MNDQSEVLKIIKEYLQKNPIHSYIISCLQKFEVNKAETMNEGQFVYYLF